MVEITERIAFCSLTEARLKKYKHLNAPAIALLVYLGEKGQTEVKTLEEVTKLDEVILNTFLSDLEADGLVVHQSPWSLTDDGKKLAKELIKEIMEINKKMDKQPSLKMTLMNDPFISITV